MLCTRMAMQAVKVVLPRERALIMGFFLRRSPGYHLNFLDHTFLSGHAHVPRINARPVLPIVWRGCWLCFHGR